MYELDVHIKALLDASDQQKAWEYLYLLTLEYLTTGHKGRIEIDFQNHRINDIRNHSIAAGTSQFSYYLEKIKL